MESWSIGEALGARAGLEPKGMGNMRKLFLIGLLGITALTGCTSGHSLLTSREKEKADDPLYSSAEQKRRARYLVPLPLNDDYLVPRAGRDPVLDSPHGQ
jgi:hypothetical protein